MSYLSEATTREGAGGETFTYRELARETHKASGKVLAVAERSSDRTLVLCREVERSVKGEDGKRSRENGTEKVLKPTSALADFAHAVEAGLL